jgi:hypothetical protein
VCGVPGNVVERQYIREVGQGQRCPGIHRSATAIVAVRPDGAVNIDICTV